MESNVKNIESIESVCEKYKLSEEEYKTIRQEIYNIMLLGKKAEKYPLAIIDIAPPGSGKTGLNGMGLKQIKDENVVIINSDEIKPFHPKIDEIAKLYPQYYTKVTNQESNPWTDDLFLEAVKNNYNIIFEGTGRNIKLLKNMIQKMENYKVIIRGMAVNEMNCLMSIIERYEGQVKEKGWGRLVTLEHFYKAYEEMLDTIQQIEEFNIADEVEIYIRGNEPTNPTRIYSSNNKEFESARKAVIAGRKADVENAVKYYHDFFNKELSKFNMICEEKNIIEEIQNLYKKQKEFENER